MGLRKTGNAATWLNLTEGKFRLPSGDKQHYEEFSILEGRITNIKFLDGEYQGQKFRKVAITVNDGHATYSFSMSLSSSYARQLLFKVATGDLTQPFEFAPIYAEEGGRKNSGMFVNQFGRPLRQKWTRDNPGDMPPRREVRVNGQILLDSTEQNEWIEQYVNEVMLPVIKQANEQAENERRQRGDTSANGASNGHVEPDNAYECAGVVAGDPNDVPW